MNSKNYSACVCPFLFAVLIHNESTVTIQQNRPPQFANQNTWRSTSHPLSEEPGLRLPAHQSSLNDNTVLFHGNVRCRSLATGMPIERCPHTPAVRRCSFDIEANNWSPRHVEATSRTPLRSKAHFTRGVKCEFPETMTTCDSRQNRS